MLTGIDLSSINATAVLLHMVGTDYRPITLGISERYDEYGCIEGVARDRNIEMVCDFFSAARRAGRFLPEAQTHTGNPEWFDPDIEIEALLYLVEQATTCAEIFQESQGG